MPKRMVIIAVAWLLFSGTVGTLAMRSMLKRGVSADTNGSQNSTKIQFTLQKPITGLPNKLPAANRRTASDNRGATNTLRGTAISGYIPVKVTNYGYSRDCWTVKLIFKVSKCQNKDQTYSYYDSTDKNAIFLMSPREVKFNNLTTKLLKFASDYYSVSALGGVSDSPIREEITRFKNCQSKIKDDFTVGSVTTNTLHNCEIDPDKKKHLIDLVSELGGTSMADGFANYTLATLNSANQIPIKLTKADIVNFSTLLSKNNTTIDEVKNSLINDYASTILANTQVFGNIVQNDNTNIYLSKLINDNTNANSIGSDDIKLGLFKETLLSKILASQPVSRSASAVATSKNDLIKAINASGSSIDEITNKLPTNITGTRRAVSLSDLNLTSVNQAIVDAKQQLLLGQSELVAIQDQINSASKFFAQEYAKTIKNQVAQELLSVLPKFLTMNLVNWQRNGYTWTSSAVEPQNPVYMPADSTQKVVTINYQGTVVPNVEFILKSKN